MEEVIGIILVALLAIAFGTTLFTMWQQRQFTTAPRKQKRKRTPPEPPRRPSIQHFERSYDYRMIIGSKPDAADRWEEVLVYTYDHSQGDWPRGSRIIPNMPQTELDAYFQSLRANGWEQIGEEDGQLPLIVYYRRPIDHPLKRGS